MIRSVVVCTLIAITGSGIAAMSLSQPTPVEMQVRTPEAWYYDEINDRHWHEGHGHWHDGPPPPVSQRGASSGSTLASGGSSFSIGGGLGSGATTPSNAAPPGRTPEPWEYDAENDRHWHAGHGHYHPGPPPPPDQRN